MYFNIFSFSNDKEIDCQIEESEYKKNIIESIKKKKKKDNEYILKKAESARKASLRKKFVQKAIY